MKEAYHKLFIPHMNVYYWDQVKNIKHVGMYVKGNQNK